MLKQEYEGYDAPDPAVRAKLGQFFGLIVEVVAIACFFIGTLIFDRFKSEK